MYVVVWHANDGININTWMDGWMDGWMNGWMDGWMDGWMGGCECKLNANVFVVDWNGTML